MERAARTTAEIIERGMRDNASKHERYLADFYRLDAEQAARMDARLRLAYQRKL